MSKGKYASKRGKSSKPLALVLSLVLLITATVGGTLAWLGDRTETVVNTFSTSGIDIELKEHEYLPNTNTLDLTKEPTAEGNSNYKMIPGWTIPKDPKVTVLANSEDCYLFVKVTRENNFDDFMDSEIADDWEKLEVDGEEVYYMIFNSKSTEAEKPAKGTAYSILANDQVTVRSTIKEENMKDLTEATYPKISFTAYAVQYWENADEYFEPAEAWGYAKDMALNSGATPNP